MKHLFISFIILTTFTSYGQAPIKFYKSFTDTVFEPGDKIRAPEIHFSLSGGMFVLPKFHDSIQVISDFLREFPEMNIQIGTHTDSRGSSISNLKLSEHRAKSIKSELVNKFGISPKRITIKGYGESKLLIKDADIERAHSNQQKEKLHQLNRRTEIMILK